MFSYEDDLTIRDGVDITGGVSEIKERFSEWLSGEFDHLWIASADKKRIINASRKIPEHLSHVSIEIVGDGACYASETSSGEELVPTDAGAVPRKYFLTDENVEKVVGHFLENIEKDPSFEWVDADVLFEFWD